MIRKWIGITALAVAAGTLLSLSSCARDQQLQGITISPASFTYFSPAPQGAVQTPIPLTAYGSYIHPPANKDITSQVTWATDNSVVADVSSAGQLTDGVACGVANISASFYTSGNKSGNVVVGFMTVTVDGPASQGCPQGTATHNLAVDVTAGAADGVISSSPTGINCGSTCTAAFPSSSSVTLTATPTGTHNFLGWTSGCTSVSGNTCTVTMNADVTVFGSFD
ncbi:MAG TPA: hypothetical protein VE377_11070 [Candidatus Dormibacteraeota bacterium]|nr:hypothetical protein [Candidatus Dormibacteraeota bacterium]